MSDNFTLVALHFETQLLGGCLQLQEVLHNARCITTNGHVIYETTFG